MAGVAVRNFFWGRERVCGWRCQYGNADAGKVERRTLPEWRMRLHRLDDRERKEGRMEVKTCTDRK